MIPFLPLPKSKPDVRVLSAHPHFKLCLVVVPSALLPRARTVAGLPLQPKERFKYLFGVKREWSLDELAPYVKPLLEPGKDATKLVLQHARSVYANDGSVSYVSR